MPQRRVRFWSQHLLGIGVLLATLLVSAWLFGSANGIWRRPWGFWAAAYDLKTLIEIIAAHYAVFYLLVALYYRPQGHHVVRELPEGQPRCTVVAYLCCDDIDLEAVNTILDGATTGAELWIHDDSATEDGRSRVDACASRLRRERDLPIRVVRRPNHSGGKPGALNHLLERLPPDVEFVILCDSDSYLPPSGPLAAAMRRFDDPEVAIVQFRNTGHARPADAPGYRILSDSVTFYDAFVRFLDRFGWSPFLGHGAILRVSAIRAVGGFTPGQLADDIDVSVKLRAAGFRVRYAREVPCGERHPESYDALRRRTRKWAYGCTQVLMRHGWRVATGRGFSFMEKLTFFLTVSYYHLQCLLALYLCLFYLVLPFEGARSAGWSSLFFSAGLILLLTFLPSITYFAREGRFREWPRAACCWGFVYGSQDWAIIGGVLRCLARREMTWVPTNLRDGGGRGGRFMPEVLFGGLIVIAALTANPVLLLLPTTILFAGKYLVAPVLNEWVFLSGAHGPLHRADCRIGPRGEERRAAPGLPALGLSTAGSYALESVTVDDCLRMEVAP